MLIAVKKDPNPIKISINDAGEEVWVKISRKTKSLIIMGSLDTPPRSYLSYIQNLCLSTKAIIMENKNAIFWFGGNFNLPNIGCSLLLATNIPSPLMMNF